MTHLIESGLEIVGIVWLCWGVWTLPEIGRVCILGKEARGL